MNAGYCFVDFASHASAVKALLGLNGTMVPGTNKIFKLNWATGGGLSDKKYVIYFRYAFETDCGALENITGLNFPFSLATLDQRSMMICFFRRFRSITPRAVPPRL